MELILFAVAGCWWELVDQVESGCSGLKSSKSPGVWKNWRLVVQSHRRFLLSEGSVLGINATVSQCKLANVRRMHLHSVSCLPCDEDLASRYRPPAILKTAACSQPNYRAVFFIIALIRNLFFDRFASIDEMKNFTITEIFYPESIYESSSIHEFLDRLKVDVVRTNLTDQHGSLTIKIVTLTNSGFVWFQCKETRQSDRNCIFLKQRKDDKAKEDEGVTWNS